jgi:hypothetical protein
MTRSAPQVTCLMAWAAREMRHCGAQQVAIWGLVSECRRGLASRLDAYTASHEMLEVRRAERSNPARNVPAEGARPMHMHHCS